MFSFIIAFRLMELPEKGIHPEVFVVLTFMQSRAVCLEMPAVDYKANLTAKKGRLRNQSYNCER
jgi:hypothetical protein